MYLLNIMTQHWATCHNGLDKRLAKILFADPYVTENNKLFVIINLNQNDYIEWIQFYIQ